MLGLFSLEGKVALVTGAGANGGVGHAIALGFAAAGADLLICDRDSEGLATTARELEPSGRRVLAVLADVADAEAVEELFVQADRHFGRLDILVNVPFAFPSRTKPHRLAVADWEATLRGSLSCYFLCAQQALLRMLAQPRGGVILNIGSNAGISALGRGALPYGCAKAAVHQMTRDLAVEYAGANIRCNALVPAQILTPGLTEHLEDPRFQREVLPAMLKGLPKGSLLEPGDLVGPAVFLASEAARAVNGALLCVDQGNTALNAGGSANWQPPA